jgi:hypothetical protein
LEALHQKYRDQGLVVLGMNNEEDHAKIREFAQGRMSYPILLDATQQFRDYGIRAIPTAVYIDKKGKVRYGDIGFRPGGEQEMERKVQELLADP